jgi:hypothetical protein
VSLDTRLRAAVAAEAARRKAAPDGAAAAAFAGAAGGGGGGGGAAADFLLALALCNTVVPTATDDGTLLYQVREGRGGFGLALVVRRKPCGPGSPCSFVTKAT